MTAASMITMIWLRLLTEMTEILATATHVWNGYFLSIR